MTISTKSLKELADELRTGSITSLSLIQHAIENHNRNQASLNAYKTWDQEFAIEQACAADAVFASDVDMGPLQGLPVSVKDLYAVKGYPTFAGTPKRLPSQWEVEGPIISKLRRQLGVIMGKTHTVEFAFSGLGVNPHWETPRNPWDISEKRVPGGSSSGAGVSLCVGSSVLALGTDTAGSVRIPASMTANVGLKLSLGRWSMAGVVPLSPSLDSAGILTRTVEDCTFAFLALDSETSLANGQLNQFEEIDVTGLRLGICDGLLWDDCSPGVAEGVKTAIDELVDEGARLMSIKWPEVDQVFPIFKNGGLAAVELYQFLKAELPDWLNLLDEKIAQRMEEAATLPAFEYLDRVAFFSKLKASTDERLRSVDVIISPTVCITPPILSETEDLEFHRKTNLLSLRNTCIVNYLGLCAITLPVALDKASMPVGMQLIARHGEEKHLLAVALTFEQVLGRSRNRLGLPACIV